MTDFFPQAPMLPYYKYSGQGNLYSPRGYAQGTLVDLLNTRNLADETEEIIEGTTEKNQPAFEEVKDSDTQSFFGGMDINEGDNLSFDDLSDLSLTDGLFGGTTVSDNAPRGWNTQHQREFDALRAAGLKPSAKWTGNDWDVFAKELDGTPFGEPGFMTLADSFTSGGKYGGQPMGLFGSIAGMATGSFKPGEVFEKNLAEALQEKTPPPEEISIDEALAPGVITAPPPEEINIDKALGQGTVTAKQGGTVTAKEGGTVKAKQAPKPAPKTQKQKTDELRKSIEAAVAAAKKKKEDENREQEKAARQGSDANRGFTRDNSGRKYF